MKLKYDFVIQEVADDFVAVAVGDSAADFNGLVRLNGTGKTIFEQLQKGADEDEIVKVMLEKYDTTEEVLKTEVNKFVASLRESGILVD